MSDELIAFVDAAKQHGVDDAFTVALLKEHGWPERAIYRAFAEHYARAGLALPVRRSSSENARDAFYYLLNFITLGSWAIALGQIFYILIAHAFPDPTLTQYAEPWSLRDEIATQVAVVIVALPVFLFVHNLITRELRARPELYESGVRRWLTYTALVVAAMTVIGDAVWFIQAFISGGLTIRFVLDSLVLLLLAGGIFTYYLTTIDRPTSAA